MKRICVLLNGPITNDARVGRFVRAASRLAYVTLFCEKGHETDANFFGSNVAIHALDARHFRSFGLRRHLLVHRHFDLFIHRALEVNRSYDLVCANDYPTLYPAAKIARACGAPLLYDSHEIFLETLNQFYPTESQFPKSMIFRGLIAAARKIGRRVERRLMAEVDVFMTTSESYAAYFQASYGRENAVIIRNCPERVDAIGAGTLIRDALGLSQNDRVILYQGMMNLGRGLSQLVRSAKYLAPNMFIVLLGDGWLRETLQGMALDLGLQRNVRFLDAVPHRELVRWTSSADLGVLLLEGVNESKRLASANKVFEYMAAGIPMLLTDLPENRRIIDQCDSGFLTNDLVPKSVAASITQVFGNPQEMRRRGENGRRAHLEQYNWETEERHLLSTLEAALHK